MHESPSIVKGRKESQQSWEEGWVNKTKAKFKFKTNSKYITTDHPNHHTTR
jgi:helix-turn-helix protein